MWISRKGWVRFDSLIISVYEWSLNGGMALPGIGVFIPHGEFKKGADSRILKHELAHILQSKRKGKWYYYRVIAPLSFYSAVRSVLDKKYKHYDHWVEKSANNYAMLDFKDLEIIKK